MEWVKLIATPPYYIDPALLRAGEAAEVLFCRGLAYCGSVESKGVIDKTVLSMLCPRPAPRAAALVREGLWIDQGGHYLVRSWEKWQDEHDAAADRRRKDRDRKRESRRTTADVSVDSPRDMSRRTAECRALDVEGEVEKEKTKNLTATAVAAEFEEFWKLYPRKIGKQAAEKAYRRARKQSSIEEILTGVARFADERQGQDPQFTPHAATWLNAGRWADEPVLASVSADGFAVNGRDPHDEWGFD